jgi:CheY-like chemotaxis protein
MRKILFMIDDDQDDREIFQEAIINCNASVELVFAEDGEQALKLLASGKTQPDVIFLDYNMPRMSGIECLKKLKSNEKTKNIPTIMYTTSGDREQEKVLLLLGADHYMRKTTSFMELCKELQRLLAIVDTDPGQLKSLIPRTEL